MLTEKTVRTIRRKGRYGHKDGLLLAVSATGSKSWVLRLYAGNGRRAERGLGPWPTVSLAEAMQRAEALRVQWREGDPAATRAKKRAVPTLTELTREVHDVLVPTWKSAQHGREWLSSMQRLVLPYIGTKPVDAITPLDVLAVLRRHWYERPETARRIRQRLGIVFDYAEELELRTDSPMRPWRAALQTVKRRNHYRAEHHSRVGQTVDAIWHSNARPSMQLLIALLALTAARSGEVRGVTWDEIDLKAAPVDASCQPH